MKTVSPALLMLYKAYFSGRDIIEPEPSQHECYRFFIKGIRVFVTLEPVGSRKFFNWKARYKVLDLTKSYSREEYIAKELSRRIPLK